MQEAETMTGARGAHKVERVTITLLPRGDERTLFHVPSTYNQIQRTYGWRRSESFEYMIVPTHVSSKEVRVDFFVNFRSSVRRDAKDIQKALRNFVESKVDSEWKGLKLGSIGRPTIGSPPREVLLRGAIEDILGSDIGF
jgi:hypothetical protein